MVINYLEKTIINNNNDLIYINDILNKLQEKTRKELEIYIKDIEKEIEEYIKIKENICNILDIRDKVFICKKAIFKEDLELIRKKNEHNLDNREPEELLIQLIIHNINEKMTILESMNLDNQVIIEHNPKASHCDLFSQNSEPDLIIKINDKIFELEQQTAVKKYTRVYCKTHKIKRLKDMSKDDRNIFIIQKIVKENEKLYSLVNATDSFIYSDFGMDRRSNKGIMMTENTLTYMTLNEVIDCLRNIS